MTIHIPAELDGRILRSYLKLTLGLSTAVLASLKNHERGILVNGERVTVRYILRAGDVLELADRDTPESVAHQREKRGLEAIEATPMALDILYEDEYVIALNKPPHMPTHPSHGHLSDTLANGLAHRYREAAEPFVFRPLGRLDRNTSGVVVAGKTRAASGFMSRALQRGEVRKRYLALVEGEFPHGVGREDVPPRGCDKKDGDIKFSRKDEIYTVRAPICRPDAGVIMRAVCDPDAPGALSAETRFRVLATGGGYSLLLCEPVTGRTHQLRVHLSYLGHPILGDELYGSVSPLVGRHALHALSLSLPMPFCTAKGDIEKTVDTQDLSPDLPLNAPTPDGRLHTWAPLPEDMSSLILSLFPDLDLPLAPGSVPRLGDLPLLPSSPSI